MPDPAAGPDAAHDHHDGGSRHDGGSPAGHAQGTDPHADQPLEHHAAVPAPHMAPASALRPGVGSARHGTALHGHDSASTRAQQVQHQHAAHHAAVTSAVATPALLTPHDTSTDGPAHTVPLDDHVSGALTNGQTDDEGLATPVQDLSSVGATDLTETEADTTAATAPTAVDPTAPLPPPDAPTAHGLTTALTDEFGTTHLPHPIEDQHAHHPPIHHS